MTNRTIDASKVGDVLEEIMLCINNHNFDIYSARDAVVDIINNFAQENSDVPYREPSEEDYDAYAFEDEETDDEEDESQVTDKSGKSSS